MSLFLIEQEHRTKSHFCKFAEMHIRELAFRELQGVFDVDDALFVRSHKEYSSDYMDSDCLSAHFPGSPLCL